MNLDEFLRNLHFDVDKVRPVDLEVDWEDAPLPFKLYQGLPAINLSLESSLKLNLTQSRTGLVTVQDMGDFCWYGYGLSQIAHLSSSAENGAEPTQFLQMFRRYVPSGGALFPSELYAYLKLQGLSPGIYHYDVAHHRFVLLREGNFDGYLQQALGRTGELTTNSFATLFVSIVFYKNFFKYNNFAYRLQGLDAGVLIGQLTAAAKQYGFESKVHFQFLDKAINHLLGISENEETVYALVSLSEEADVSSFRAADAAHTQRTKQAEGKPSECLESRGTLISGGMPWQAENADSLCKKLPGLQHRHLVKSQQVREYPMLIEANEAAMADTTESFFRTPLPSRPMFWTVDAGISENDIVKLPKAQNLDWDFATACRKRFSPGLDFVSSYISIETLSALLQATVSPIFTGAAKSENPPISEPAGDAVQDPIKFGISIAGCFHGVDGLADGAYVYDPSIHGLKLVNSGDHRMRLQRGMSMPNVNLFQVPFCFHLVGRRDFYKEIFGYRGYRVQQMETGMLLQQLLLRAAAMDMGGHPLLGYDEKVCDDIYGFDNKEQTCLIQVPVGYYRKMTRFEGNL